MEKLSTDLLVNFKPVRTDLHCHSCSKNFIAKIDYLLNGNHEIECVFCGHIHYRFVKDGKVTDDRYHSDSKTHKVEKRNMWKSQTVPVVTSTASAFIRDSWLRRYEDE